MASVKSLDKNLYGYWKVESDPFKIGNFYYIQAFCTHCNKTRKNIRKTNLVKGYTVGCGCHKKPYTVEFDIKIHGAKSIYNTYKSSANTRGITFNLSFEVFIEFLNKPCFYCGKENSNLLKLKGQYLPYNGIDRWDNALGYNQGNCVTSCVTCNRMKLNINNGNSFIEQVKKIVNYQKEING